MSNISQNWQKLLSKQNKQKKATGVVSKPKKNVPSSKKSTIKTSSNSNSGSIRKPLTKLAEEQRNLERSSLKMSVLADPTSTTNTNNKNSKSTKNNTLSNRKQEIGKYLAMDCEFVGVGPQGIQSELARVSIVNFHGHVIYDKFVKPREKVTDWRTFVSGIRPSDMHNAIPFKEAQKDVSELLQDRILVGHAIHHDLEALYLTHPKRAIRDTSKHVPFKQKFSKGKTPSLKKLAVEILGINIQGGEHSSVEDARATMLIYKSDKANFEEKIRSNSYKS